MFNTTANPIITRPIQSPIEHDELATLLAIINAAYAEYAGKLTPPSGAHTETEASLAAKLAQGAGALAWLGEEAVGSVLFEPRGDALYLGRLAVIPAYRGRGVGARLVHYVEAEAIASGHTHITLGVRLQLPENTAFYTKLGYHIADYGSHPGFNTPTYMTMVKPLKR